MRTKFKPLIFLTVTVFFFSCRKQDVPEQNTAIQSEIISLDIARQVAKGFALIALVRVLRLT